MSFAPIALTIPQYEDYPNYWLKAYEQGTVTPLAMATDETGSTLLVKAELDAQGFPITAGNARIIPFIDGYYDLWLFPTESDADGNITANAIQFANNITGNPQSSVISNIASLRLIEGTSGQEISLTGYYADGDGGSGGFYWDSASTDTDNGGTIIKATSVTTGRWLRIYYGAIDVRWFGAKADGITDDSAAITAAIVVVASGGSILFSGGTFLISQVSIVSKTGVKFISDNSSILKKEYSVTGSIQHIFNISLSSDLVFEGLAFEGTGSDNVVYDTTNRFGGLFITTSSFIQIIACNFNDFSSYGILAQSLTGGTYTEGVIVDRCIFHDFPLDTTNHSAFQTGIILGVDGEYSSIINNRFYAMPSAIRCTDGANALIAHNVIMQMNGTDGTLQTDRACIYCTVGSTNTGKITISHNKINHNETGVIPILCRGDATKPQNAFIIDFNDCLVNGLTAVHDYQIYLIDAPNSRIAGNQVRGLVNLSPAITLVSSTKVVISDNYLKGGTYALSVDNTSSAYWSQNITEGNVTAKLLVGATGIFYNNNNRSFAFRISAAGVAANTPWDDAAFTASRVGLGHFRITHDIGSTDYSVSIELDNDATAPERSISVVRATTQLDYYVKDSGGTLIDDDFLITIVIGQKQDKVVG